MVPKSCFAIKQIQKQFFKSYFLTVPYLWYAPPCWIVNAR